ncbi:MAG: GWxTD domain-containing protein [Cyclonatronaceae bacterium]
MTAIPYTFLKASFLYTLALLLLAGCAGSGENRYDAGTSRAYQTGYPEVLGRVTSFFDEQNRPVADLSIELPHQHLIFRSPNGEARFAEVRLRIAFRRLSGEENGQITARQTQRLRIDARPDTPGANTQHTTRQQLAPGHYLVEISATDLSSQKTSRIELEVEIPDPEGEAATASDISMLLRGEGEQRRVSSYLVPAEQDSLLFEFFVARDTSHAPVDITLRLLRFHSDTEPARAMGDLPLTSGNIAYRGIKYSDREVVREQQRQLQDETGAVLISYGVPVPEEGNYRFEIELNTADSLGREVSERSFRDFAMVSPNFPAVSSTREMAAPLKYLMRRREYERMMAINDPDSLRLAVERFWLEDMNQEQARRQIQRYYSRVEEANRLFSSFKAGWKTDMGMVFILVGAPLRVEEQIDAVVWYYGYNQFDPSTVMVFERARPPGPSWPFSHYVLMRNRYFQSLEVERISDWRSGRISRR